VGSSPLTDGLPKVLNSERVYEGSLFNVDHDRLRFSDGIESDRSIVRHPGAVAIVALLDDNRCLLVEQYRHGPGLRTLEIPAGTRESGEEPAVTARRELREETGYDAGSLVRLGGAWMAPGFTDEYIDFYLATDLFDAPLDSGDEHDLSAPISIMSDELGDAIAEGKIEDAKTIVAFSLYGYYLEGAVGNVRNE
jgi:ADP-ribose pyrophosphatase